MALVGLEVWSDVDKCPITQDPFTTLHEFLDWRKVKLLPQKPHDNAQLIRYCSRDAMPVFRINPLYERFSLFATKQKMLSSTVDGYSLELPSLLGGVEFLK